MAGMNGPNEKNLPASGQCHSNKKKSLWMMVGKPGEGKPRHYMSGTTGISSDM